MSYLDKPSSWPNFYYEVRSFFFFLENIEKRLGRNGKEKMEGIKFFDISV